MDQSSMDYARVERAIEYLVSHHLEQPDLVTVAHHVHLSEYHFQRLFSRWAGTSPKRFLQCLTVEHAKRKLAESRPLLDVTLESGLSSPGRLHDLFVTIEALTPGEYKSRGGGLTIQYGIHATPFGACLLAVTERGICSLSFVDAGDEHEAELELKRRWSGARCEQNDEATEPIAACIFARLDHNAQPPLHLLLMGTNFQVKVWHALLQIPEGTVASYETVAERIGKPNATRAVAGAISSNPIAYLIPCHRVIRKTGVIGEYRWGSARKRAILSWEDGHRVPATR